MKFDRKAWNAWPPLAKHRKWLADEWRKGRRINTSATRKVWKAYKATQDMMADTLLGPLGDK